MGNDGLTARSPLVVTNTTSVTGKLALNAPLITSLDVVNIGNGSTSNPGATFQKNLRIANLSGALQSFQSGTLDVGSEGVALFPGKFATASKSKEAVSNSLSNCGSSCVHWEKLTRKDGNNGIYLVYGESADLPPVLKWQRLGDSDCFWNKYYTNWYGNDGCSSGALSMYFHCPLVRNAYDLEAGERWGPNSYTKTAWEYTTNCTSGYWEPQEHKTQWCQWYVDWLNDTGRNAILLEGAFKDTLHKYTGELCDQENIIGVQTIGDGGGMDGSAAFGYDQFDAFGCAAYLCTRE